MERGFGADFSNVRVHTGKDSIYMNQILGAQAFASGNDIISIRFRKSNNSKIMSNKKYII